MKVIGPNFTGLSNYVKLLSLDLPKYLGNTMLLWILGFVPQITISLLLAVWFTDNRLRIRLPAVLQDRDLHAQPDHGLRVRHALLCPLLG